MSYKIPFPGTAGLKEVENTIIAYQLGKTANLVDLVGLEAAFEDKTSMNVNLAEFSPVDHRPQIHKHLIFVLEADVDFGAMAAASMRQLGGAGKTFRVFVSDELKDICIFFRL
jgi:hypothetical protein